jgi:hypothetical protein
MKRFGGTMTRFFIGIILGIILLFLFLYFGGPGYLETFGKKAEDTGKSLKKYEQTTRDTAKKVEEKYEDVKKKFGSDDKEKTD